MEIAALHELTRLAGLINSEIARAIALQNLWERSAIVPGAADVLAAANNAKLTAFPLDPRDNPQRSCVYSIKTLR